MSEQRVRIAQQVHNFAIGDGKDCKLFLNILHETNGEKLYYQVPLTTIVSIQVFTSTQKESVHTFGDADPIALRTGFKRIAGHLTAVVFNESIAEKIRKQIKTLRPVSARSLNLEDSGVIRLDELEHLTHLDQLPPCEIKMFMKNAITKMVFSKSIYGVKFTSSGSTIGGSAAMAEQYSFVAVSTSAVRKEKVDNENEIDPNNSI